MPRTYRRRTYRPRTYRRKVPYGSRRPTRRFAVKKRAYRKKTTSGNFRKRILNTTSRKKQDTMSPATVSIAGITPDVSDGPIAFTASDGIQMGIWNCTQRSRDTGTADIPARVDEPATRTATKCFMRGLREWSMIQTSGSGAWIWRRITFTFYSDFFYRNNGISDNIIARYALETAPGGMRRALPFFNGGLPPESNRLTKILAYIFKGAQGTDWNNPITAKTHSERVTIRSDRTRYIRSGNDSGTFRLYKDWYPMNKTLEYDEDEFGGTQVQGELSTANKTSMGDYYIFDIFQPTVGVASDEQLTFDPEATLFWHER
ncbi:MAG: capsid protein [Genomoviridae sp.]|nr:MAG: capsid protein [Genomoviridae sp.]